MCGESIDLVEVLGGDLAAELDAVAVFLEQAAGEPVDRVDLVRTAVSDFCALTRLVLPAAE